MEQKCCEFHISTLYTLLIDWDVTTKNVPVMRLRTYQQSFVMSSSQLIYYHRESCCVTTYKFLLDGFFFFDFSALPL